MEIESLITLLNSTVALIISIIALVYTVKTYLLKSGSSIRASYSTCSSSVSCEDQYVSSLTLENLKDRAVVIFKIYLKVGYNYYIELEDFDEKPLILKPFEAFKKEYDPIDLYSINLNRINLNKLFDNLKVKKQIILSTSDGKYVVRTWIKRWDPVYDFFKNHITAVIRPQRATYKGKSYGINAKYLIDIKTENNKEEIIPIYPHDYEIKKFIKFRLTKESIESKELLEEHLNNQIKKGLLSCKEIKVYDMKTWLEKIYDRQNNRIINAEYYDWFTYNVVGPVLTKLSNIRLRQKNKHQRKGNS